MELSSKQSILKAGRSLLSKRSVILCFRSLYFLSDVTVRYASFDTNRYFYIN